MYIYILDGINNNFGLRYNSKNNLFAGLDFINLAKSIIISQKLYPKQINPGPHHRKSIIMFIHSPRDVKQ